MVDNLTEKVNGYYELKFKSSFFPWKPILKKWKSIEESPKVFKDLKNNSVSNSLSRILNYLQYDIRNKIELLETYNSKESIIVSFLNRKLDRHVDYLRVLNKYYFIQIASKLKLKE